MTTFENPANGYKEDVTGFSVVWAFLFGLFYFLVKGLWTHAVIQAVLVAVCIMTFGPGGIVPMFFIWIGYAFAAPSILEARYRRLGWREVGGGLPPSGHINARNQSLPAAQQRSADTKECPRCAETIKAAAKVCRFCGADLTQGASGHRSHAGAEPSDGDAAQSGDQVRHRDFGVGFVVRETEPGKLLVRFNSGHQVVRKTELAGM